MGEIIQSHHTADNMMFNYTIFISDFGVAVFRQV